MVGVWTEEEKKKMIKKKLEIKIDSEKMIYEESEGWTEKWLGIKTSS